MHLFGDGPSLAQIPPALQARWCRHLEAGEITRSVTCSTAYTIKLESLSGYLDVDSSWRDLYTSNQLQVDETELRRVVSKPKDKTKTLYRRKTVDSLMSTHRARCRCGTKMHPQGNTRLVWDLVGMIMVLYDCLMVPVRVGFALDVARTGVEFSIHIVAMIYWFLDIVLNFETGYFQGATLISSRKQVAARYLRTWFLPDVFIVALDVVFVTVPDFEGLSMFRGVRALRILRLLRILKMSKLSNYMEEVFTNIGAQWLILVIAIINTLFLIYLMAHCLACMWYWIGELGFDMGWNSWIDLVEGFDDTTIFQRYTRALYWVLGHLTAAPVDPTQAPQNEFERCFTVSMILCSLLVIGSGISQMTNTISELNRQNQEAKDIKLQLRRYLKAAGASSATSYRIIRFALHSHQRRNVMALDPLVYSLLSETLSSEMAASQRSSHLVMHPLFAFLSVGFEKVFQHVCRAFVAHVYSDGDVVWTNGTWAESLFITVHGTYQLLRVDREEDTLEFDHPLWLSELSLYCKVMHHSKLTALTFADAFAITGPEFIACIKRSPVCIACVYRYATEYLATCWDGADPPEGKHTTDDIMPEGVEEQSCNAMRKAFEAMDCSLECDYVHAADVDEFLHFIRSESQAGAQDILDALPRTFPELRDASGIYAQVEHMEECLRCKAAMMNIVFFARDRYDDFTGPQKLGTRMTRETWAKWQVFVGWVNLNEDMTHALLVFLAIRGVGKIKMFAKALGKDKGTPEMVVQHILENVPRMVPSCRHLSQEQRSLILSCLDLHAKFNLAQLLQGENTPFHVAELQAHLQDVGVEGFDLLKMYLMSWVGIMSALMGAKHVVGSAFMTESNASNLLVGIQSLQHLFDAEPQGIYWGFIVARVRQLKIPVAEPEHLALARLACLTRASSKDFVGIKSSWDSLAIGDRNSLTSFFLADGIIETAYVFTFLPLYLSNCRSNPSVGLARALTALLDLLDVLRADGYAEQAERSTIMVDIQDVAQFAKNVRSPRVFAAVAHHSNFVFTGREVNIYVTPRHRERAQQSTWLPDPTVEMSTVVRKLERSVLAVQGAVEDAVRDTRAPIVRWI